jgi:hypothetical protein
MAQINPNIALSVNPPKFDTGVNQLAMMEGAMKLGEMQRGVESQNKLRDLYSQGVDISTPEGFKQVASIDPATAIKLRKDALEGQKLQGEIKKTGFELTEKGMGIMRERSKDLLQNTSDENYIAHIQEGLRDGLISPEQAKRSVQIFTAVPANQRAAFITNNLAKAEKLFEAKTITAAQEQANLTARRGQDITAQTTRRGQDLQYAPDVVANTVTDATGNVTQFNRFGQVIGKPGAVGKPSAQFEKTAALQKQMGRDLDLAITEIENAIKKGGTLDKSTASGAGRLLDAAGNFIGYATEGSVAAAELKPIADLGLKMVPRFEGPQSDKDTASYIQASGQLANESLPVATRRAAAETVVRLMKSRKGQFVNQTMANEGIGAGAPALPGGFQLDK